MKETLYLFIAITLYSCFSPPEFSSPDKKLFINSVRVGDGKRIDWYFFSLIGGFSRSYLQYEDKGGEQQRFFESFYLTDVSLKRDTLIVQLWKNEYEFDKDRFGSLGLFVKIDTTGGQWNEAASRLGRLQTKNVDFEHPHFTDTYCPKGECY